MRENVLSKTLMSRQQLRLAWRWQQMPKHVIIEYFAILRVTLELCNSFK
jgi:hypothetical protein